MPKGSSAWIELAASDDASRSLVSQRCSRQGYRQVGSLGMLLISDPQPSHRPRSHSATLLANRARARKAQGSTRMSAQSRGVCWRSIVPDHATRPVFWRTDDDELFPGAARQLAVRRALRRFRCVLLLRPRTGINRRATTARIGGACHLYTLLGRRPMQRVRTCNQPILRGLGRAD